MHPVVYDGGVRIELEYGVESIQVACHLDINHITASISWHQDGHWSLCGFVNFGCLSETVVFIYVVIKYFNTMVKLRWKVDSHTNGVHCTY